MIRNGGDKKGNISKSFNRRLLFGIAMFAGCFVKGQTPVTDTLSKLSGTPTVSSPKVEVPATETVSKSLYCAFRQTEVDISEITAVSNVLFIRNNSGITHTLQITIKKPANWRSLLNTEKQLVLAPGDSLFLPVRLVTGSGLSRGGIKYSFTAIVTSKQTNEIIKASFIAFKPRFSKLRMDLNPQKNSYFRNGESKVFFDVALNNESDGDIRVLMNVKKLGRDFTINDTSNSFSNKDYKELGLNAYTDTTLHLKAELFKELRNRKRLDTYGYSIMRETEPRRYTVFLKAFDLNSTLTYTRNLNNKDTVMKEVVSIGRTLNLIRLNNTRRIENVESGYFPVTMIANFTNLFNNQPALNLVFVGNTKLKKETYLNYYLQNTFNYYTIGQQTLYNTFGQVNYASPKLSVMAGNGVRLNMPQMFVRNAGVSGTGVAATYSVLRDHKIGVSVAKNGKNFTDVNSVNLSAGYAGTVRKINFGGGYNTTLFRNGNQNDIISAGLAMPITTKQYISLFGSFFNYRFQSKVFTGQQAGLSYNIRYLKDKATTNANIIYSNNPYNFLSTFVNQENSTSLVAGLNTRYTRKRYTFNLLNQYNLFPYYNVRTARNANNTVFTNNFFVNFPPKPGMNYAPGVYADYSNFFNQEVVGGGLRLNVSTFSIDQNFRLSLNMRGGFNKVINYSKLPNFFTAQVNAFMAVKVWRLNLRYFYGPQFNNDIVNVLTRQQRYYQAILTSLAHQYQFRNPHFIWENNVFYNYVNTNNRHAFGIFSQLFFYTVNGWNFNINAGFNYNAAEGYMYQFNPSAQNAYTIEQSGEYRTNYSLQVGVGVKKDFAIPLPEKWRKKRSATVMFKAFMDINGNRLQDKDELVLPNVVIRVGDYEAQTSATGEAVFKNISLGTHALSVFPLDDANAWFCLVKDSISIEGSGLIPVPFSKGGEVYGNIELERNRFSKDMFQNIDVSGLRIILTDSSGFSYTSITDKQGNFKFYVPYGRYTLQFNEKMLGNDFMLEDNYVDIELNAGLPAYYHSFIIVEKSKKIKKKRFDADGNVIEDK